MSLNRVYGSSVPMQLQTTAVLLDKNKGSLGNKMDCIGEQTKNTFTTNLKGAATGLGLGVATTVAIKSKNANKLVEKGVDALKNTEVFKKYAPKLADLAKEGISKFKNLPGSAKIIAVIGAGIGAMAGISLEREQAFKAGQIDQKYTDRAQLQKTLEA